MRNRRFLISTLNSVQKLNTKHVSTDQIDLEKVEDCVKTLNQPTVGCCLLVSVLVPGVMVL